MVGGKDCAWRSAVFFGLLVGACRAGEERPELLYGSDYFELHADEMAAPCPEVLSWLEHHYKSIAPLLGAPDVPPQPIEIFVYDSVEDLDEHGCKLDRIVDGCTVGTTVHVTVPYHPHELVHAYGALVGRPPRIFQEGLAEVLGCRPNPNEQTIERLPSLEDYFESTTFVERGGNSAQVYASAAGFTRFLIDRHGWSRYRQFYSETEWNASVAAIGERFEEAFGEELTVALEAWRSGDAQTSRSVCLWAAECATSSLAAGDAELACGPSVRGAVGAQAATINSLTLASPSQVVIRGEIMADSWSLDLLGCRDPVVPAQSFLNLSAPVVEVVTELDAGAYWSYARVADAPGLEASAGMVSATLSEPVASLPCAEAPSRDLGGTDLVVWRGGFPAAGDRRVSLRFTVAEPRRLGIVKYGALFDPDVPGQLSLCNNACPPDEDRCQSGSLAEALPFEGQWLDPVVSYVLILDPQAIDNVDYHIGIELTGS